MEQIYTIPVNEAFEASAAHPEIGCPICACYRRLEENELDLILGASMMEPDIRIKTNKRGFCRTHYDMMLTRKNRLGMALTLESHLAELEGEIFEGKFASVLTPAVGQKPVKRINELEGSCYVCEKIEYHFSRILETVALLWETDEEFRNKFAAQPYFCLPHYRRILENARVRLTKKRFPDFYRVCSELERTYFTTLSEDVSWFCKKFDYRYEQEPWNNSKDAVERAIKLLRSDLHRK